MGILRIIVILFSIIICQISFGYSGQRIVTTNKDKEIKIKAGWQFQWGAWGNDYSTVIPYIGVSIGGFKLPFGETKWKSEIEIGYFMMKAETFGLADASVIQSNYSTITIKSHGIPLTISIIRTFKVKKFRLVPKFGFGGMILIHSTSNNQSGITPFALLKTAFEIRYQISKSWGILIDNSAMVSFGSGGATLFYTPSLGVSIGF